MEKEHFEVILESIDSKFDLVLEGHESLRREMHGICDELSGKIDTNSFKIDLLNQKIDGVAADLKAHRADTEAHHGVYRVKEGEDGWNR